MEKVNDLVKKYPEFEKLHLDLPNETAQEIKQIIDKSFITKNSLSYYFDSFIRKFNCMIEDTFDKCVNNETKHMDLEDISTAFEWLKEDLKQLGESKNGR